MKSIFDLKNKIVSSSIAVAVCDTTAATTMTLSFVASENVYIRSYFVLSLRDIFRMKRRKKKNIR